MPTTRKNSHAGSWYSSDSVILSSQIDSWLQIASNNSSFDILLNHNNNDLQTSSSKGIIVPHAGYSFSGQTAAFAYTHLIPAGSNCGDNHRMTLVKKRIFIFGPSHHVYMDGCALSRCDRYETPLGHLTIDRTVNQRLLDTNLFSQMDICTDEDEHSLEMQLPFIRHLFRDHDVTIVPVLVGNLSEPKEKEYGKLFSRLLFESEDEGYVDNLFIVSSDFCHWGPRFRYTNMPSCSHSSDLQPAIHQFIEQLDRQAMDIIQKCDADAFHSYLRQTRNTICGRHPIALILRAISHYQMQLGGEVEDCVSIQFTRYDQSNKVIKPSENSVSYASAVISIQQNLE